jgi:hypothetical protein
MKRANAPRQHLYPPLTKCNASICSVSKGFHLTARKDRVRSILGN